MERREEHIFGQRTLPQMDLASISCAIQNLWLAARAEGIGVGWVSLFDPDELARLLQAPEGVGPIHCLGHVKAFYDKSMLEQENWATQAPLEELSSKITGAPEAAYRVITSSVLPEVTGFARYLEKHSSSGVGRWK